MSQWHVNNNAVNITRHPEPRGWSNVDDVEGYTEAHMLYDTAIHEAAHTILALDVGIPVRRVQIRTNSEPATFGHALGIVTFLDLDQKSLSGLLTALAAGERAQDRGARESCLWNPERAWASERRAINDRLLAAEHLRRRAGAELTYGEQPDEWTDMACHHRVADREIDRHWPRIVDFAEVLIARRYLNAQQIAAYSGLLNLAA